MVDPITESTLDAVVDATVNAGQRTNIGYALLPRLTRSCLTSRRPGDVAPSDFLSHRRGADDKSQHSNATDLDKSWKHRIHHLSCARLAAADAGKRRTSSICP